MVTTIVAFVVSVLMLISRFLESAKPIWGRLPKWLAVILPAVVSLIPQVVALLQQSKTWADLTSYLIASVAIVIAGLFPRHDPTPPDPPANS